MNDYSKKMSKILVVYIALPIVIFLLGWIKPLISIPATAVVIYCLYNILKDKDMLLNTVNITKRDFEILTLAFLIILFWVYFSGIGRFVFQNDDHVYRNAIFEMLVNNEWPIIKTFAYEGLDTPFMFVYYIGFWLPAALVGKVLGITAGYYFQAVWATIGIWLFYYLVCCYLDKISLLPLIVFVFFSGLDAVGCAIFNEAYTTIIGTEHLEWWMSGMQFSSFTTQLFWVFNQAIPAWILTLTVLMQRKSNYIVFLLGSSLIFCPFPFVGVLPFVAYVIIRDYTQDKNIKRVLLDIFSKENILGGGITGLITFFYLKTNSSGQHLIFMPGEVNYKYGFLFCLIFFVFIEIGVYVISIYKYQRKNPLLYIALLFLCTCPLIQIGYGVDYCMRVCIPAQVVIFILVVDTIYQAKMKKDLVVCATICVILAIGAVTPIHEINRTVKNTVSNTFTSDSIYTSTLSEEELMMGSMGNNFRGEIESSFFYMYLAR